MITTEGQKKGRTETIHSKWVLIFLEEIRKEDTIESWTNGGLLTYLTLFRKFQTQKWLKSPVKDLTMSGMTDFRF